ncbi:cobalt-precorrin-4 C(11)-methyltransferase [Methanobrevibacter cuticularis]|uniref:Cobalt-precorrin-4 C(11)-methyltransferase n=1 Tax=Methanobrevibacter cuticularis TaxID=47311 RepID=A0A166E165_9EURY|nr:precorrin-4 C(11)-methyltransferase [Methanobrevibacter cuticularis]KZX16164.1 cobalt-precorrin-4 C(11)-methyltransferase [Methanobrevibacter cuticularis]
MKGKVIFIGAGPGDPELLTIRGYKAIEKADIIIYAGSLVNPEVFNHRKREAKVYNSAILDLNEIIAIIEEGIDANKIIARVHTGDPSIYGAIGEQIRELKIRNVEYEIIPGVSSVFATAAALESELTLPEISQTVIITRPEGRTPKPKKESLTSLASHNATMCIFLGIGMINEVVDDLKEEYSENTPVAVVKKASWEDQLIIRGTLKDIANKVKEENITKTAMIVVGDVLNPGNFKASKLYDPNFKHEYR